MKKKVAVVAKHAHQYQAWLMQEGSSYDKSEFDLRYVNTIDMIRGCRPDTYVVLPGAEETIRFEEIIARLREVGASDMTPREGGGVPPVDSAQLETARKNVERMARDIRSFAESNSALPPLVRGSILDFMSGELDRATEEATRGISPYKYGLSADRDYESDTLVVRVTRGISKNKLDEVVYQKRVSVRDIGNDRKDTEQTKDWSKMSRGIPVIVCCQCKLQTKFSYSSGVPDVCPHCDHTMPGCAECRVTTADHVPELTQEEIEAGKALVARVQAVKRVMAGTHADLLNQCG